MPQANECPICGSSGKSRPILVVEHDSVLRCRACGTVYYSPLPTPEEQEAFYTRQWADKGSQYHDNYGDPGYEAVNLRLSFRPHLDLLARHAISGSILDIGCSVGTFLKAATEAGWDAQGTDLSEDACRISAEKTGCTVYRGEIVSLGLPAQSFDAIHAAQVIEHMPDPVGSVKEIERLLRPGGAVILAAPVIEPRVFHLTYRVQKFLVPLVSGGRELPFPWALDHPYHVVIPTRAGLQMLLESHGLRVVHSRLAPWQSFYKMNRKWRLFYHAMNGCFRVLRSGMNVELLAIKEV